MQHTIVMPEILQCARYAKFFRFPSNRDIESLTFMQTTPRKQNAIHYFFEELASEDVDVKLYKCWLGERKICKVTRTMKGSLAGVCTFLFVFYFSDRSPRTEGALEAILSSPFSAFCCDPTAHRTSKSGRDCDGQWHQGSGHRCCTKAS